MLVLFNRAFAGMVTDEEQDVVPRAVRGVGALIVCGCGGSRSVCHAGVRGSGGVRDLTSTLVSAIMGLAVLATVRPRRWHLLGLLVCASVYFTWMYHDTAVLNRMGAKVEALVKDLTYGRRVTETIWAPDDSRIGFINHIVDRACIGRCFTYSNYEPSSGQFRVRVREGSPIVTDVPELTEAMESGEYTVQAKDLPMTEIYQCDEKDLTKLCSRELSAGEQNGRLGYHPPKD